MHSSLIYQIALSLIPGIGPIKAKTLVLHCGSAEAVFKEKRSHITRIPDIGDATVQMLRNSAAFHQAEAEIKFIEQHQIVPYFFNDEKYPDRLRLCEDSPIIIYTRGRLSMQRDKIISIVGTRKATSYGKQFCHELLDGIAHLKPTVVSGLAYGIDVCAHKHCLTLGLQTIACVAHGLNRIYPPLHSQVAHDMQNNGGLISEFMSTTKMTPELFPMRNRIIAGIADCTLVIETDLKGGSMITANLANSYGREVFALPGRYNDLHSSGCNALIKRNLAAIITSPGDLIDYMNWGSDVKPKAKQLPLFLDLSEDESMVVKFLGKKGKTAVDELSFETGYAFSKLASLLLNLEFRGVVKSLPGKFYEVI